jgi:DNA modification methylase
MKDASKEDELIIRQIGDCYLINADAADALDLFEEGAIDAVVTDPPYGLSKEPDMHEVLEAWISGRDYTHGSKGFMGKEWDSFVPGPAMWSEVVRTMKPGAHLLSFAGSRTYDLMAVAIRLAELEIRDQILYLYGTGFPKSHNISKAIDKAAGAKRDVVGVREDFAARANTKPSNRQKMGKFADDAHNMGEITAPATTAAQQWDGYGTALKPAHEPLVLARKPFKGTVANNVLEHGTGAINIDGCRVEGAKPDTTRGQGGGNGKYSEIGAQGRIVDDGLGRFPANVIHDGSPEVMDLFPDAGKSSAAPRRNSARDNVAHGKEYANVTAGHDDSGSASRFFYCAKASKWERELGGTNKHPTVKPIALMSYLIRLITPPGGTVLDPFMGSGTTAIAAILEGKKFIGIERDPEYFEIACQRIEAVYQQPDVVRKKVFKKAPAKRPPALDRGRLEALALEIMAEIKKGE